jgi:hypothetical protein
MSNLSIRKTVAGHIDLSKVIAVRGPLLGWPGEFTGWFEIDVQLRDAPIKVFIPVDPATDLCDGPNRYFTFTRIGQDSEKFWSGRDDPLETVVGQRVQKSIDEFVAEWKQWRDA